MWWLHAIDRCSYGLSSGRLSPNVDWPRARVEQCDDCTSWAGLSLIESGHAKAPRRLRWSRYDDVVPAHWIVPSRCYETRVAAPVLKATDRFYDFKLGELAYAYPFARSMFEQLRRRGLLDFDCVVPIPLSPDKASRGEKHRTRALAKELARLLAVPMRDILRLASRVSKRRMLARGCTIAQFEQSYYSSLRRRRSSGRGESAARGRRVHQGKHCGAGHQGAPGAAVEGRNSRSDRWPDDREGGGCRRQRVQNTNGVTVFRSATHGQMVEDWAALGS